jgi:two-component system chemotaxis response regulator CheB
VSLCVFVRNRFEAHVSVRTLPLTGDKATPLPRCAVHDDRAKKLIIDGCLHRRHGSDPQFLMQMPSGTWYPYHATHAGRFTRSFARRLDSLVRISVQSSGRRAPGHLYIAPDHSHLTLTRSGANYMTKIDQGEPVNRLPPTRSMCLFRSAAQSAGKMPSA